MTEAVEAAIVRERGWWRITLGLVAFLVLPATPLLRIVLPIEQTILLVVPALAVCAVVGWRAGGRWPLALAWAGIGLWVLWPPASTAGSFPVLARGWGALLAGAFGGMVLLQRERTFLPRAMVAIVGAFGLAAAGILAVPGGFAKATETMQVEVARRAEVSSTQWRQMTATAEWQKFVGENPDAGKLSNEVDRQLQGLPEVAGVLFPAMLALESLLALALAWGLYHRIGRVRLGPPLARLREFRFHDVLIWGIIGGLALLVLPLPPLGRAIGVNGLVFFGALYAARGLGVLVWFLAPGRWMAVFLTLFIVFFWHVVGVVAVGIGLGDTWFDWRGRARPKSQRSE